MALNRGKIIKFLRGTQSALDSKSNGQYLYKTSFNEGEPLFITDTGLLYIGAGDGNKAKVVSGVRFGTLADMYSLDMDRGLIFVVISGEGESEIYVCTGTSWIPTFKSLKSKVEGRYNALVFDSTDQLAAWFSGSYNRPDGLKPNNLVIGQNIYIKRQDQPDYWVSSLSTPWSIANNLTVLPTDKVDLSDYVQMTRSIAGLTLHEDITKVALQQALDFDTKVDKVEGKQLSTNDYTTAEKNKLASIEAGAEVNVQSDWKETNTQSDAYIKNKPKTLVDLGVTDVYDKTEVDDRLSTKVDKVTGKGLSTNDLTNELKVIYDAASIKINAVTEGAGTSHDTLKKLYDMIVALIGTADADHNTLGKLQNRIAEEIAAQATDILKLADATVLVDEVGRPFEDENGRYFVPEYVDKWARAEILKLKEGN